jgi:hypothetical protein
VSEWCDMSIRGLLFQWAITITKKVLILILVQTEPHHHFIENQLVLAMIYLKNRR